MGTISSQIQNEDPDSGIASHLIQTELKIDFTREACPNLKQLLYCTVPINIKLSHKINQILGSISEIRGVYEKYRQRSNIPYIDKSTFCHIVPFTRMNSKFIFQNLCHEKSLIFLFFNKINKLKAFMNIFELLAILLMTSYTHYTNKIHRFFICSLFNFVKKF